MRWILFALLVSLSVLGCQKNTADIDRTIDLIGTDDNSHIKDLNTTVPEKADTHVIKNLSNIKYINLTGFKDEASLRCDLGNQHFLKAKFIYHINTVGEELIYSPVGTYKKDDEDGRWALMLYDNRNQSVYTKTLSYMLDEKYPNNDTIVCVEEYVIPKEFEKFIGRHTHLFENVTVEALEDTPWG